MHRILPVFLTLFLAACFNENFTYVQNTVTITNLESSSGGTGTIIAADRTGSTILTNSHVCEVAKAGGKVHEESGKTHFVVSFSQSKVHDLCAIKIAENLHTRAHVATRNPDFMEESTVSGHPHLLPLIVNHGHFSQKINVTIMVDTRECSLEDLKDPGLSIICGFLGRLPVLRNYEAGVISNLIQPGNSGSAVYNSDGELTDLVFAGAGDLSYGLTVPHEYVAFFLNNELPLLAPQFPDNTVSLTEKVNEKREYREKLREICEKNPEKSKISVCSYSENMVITE